MTYSLRRKSDGAGDEGGMSMVYWLDEAGDLQREHGQRPRIGAGICVGSIGGRTYAAQDHWTTTPVTEILEETETMVRFLTRSNSEYVWEIF